LIPFRNKPKSLKFIAGVNDNAKKLFIGVKDTANKLFTSAFDTGDKTVLRITAYLYLKKRRISIQLSS